MKSRITFLVIFLLAFIIGCVSVFVLIKNTPVPDNTNELSSPKKKTEPRPKADLLKQKNQTFEPQIFGLKDFTEDRFPPELFKLVDVVNHGSTYRKNEVIAKNGENWLGLFFDGENSYLKKTRVGVFVDKQTDYDGKRKWVSAKFENKTPLFIVKNAKSLRDGKVTTLFRGKTFEDDEFDYEQNTMNRGFVREYKIGDRTYSFQVKDALTKSGDEVLALVLTNGSINQIVTYGAYFDEYCLGYLLWVGDLDDDGKLDFYMKFEDFEKGFFSSSLFLSSEAEKGDLVKRVAAFGTLGC